MNLNQLSGELSARAGFGVVLQAILGVSLSLNVLQGVVNASSKVTHHETLIPTTISRNYWAEDDVASQDYLEDMGFTMLQLAVNVTPASVDYQAKKLLRYAAPGYYGALQNQLMASAAAVKAEGVSTVFSPKEVKIDLKSQTVAYTGVLSRFIQDKKVGERSTSFAVKFSIEHGRMYLHALLETDAKNSLVLPNEKK
jgi:type IV conjugative transfer system protein TraE